MDNISKSPFLRRRPVGKNGGRKVTQDFFFAPSDGDKYPSESVAIRNNRVPDDPNRLPSWSWALSKMQNEGIWLVVPIRGIDAESVKRNINVARASIWRTAHRRGIDLASEYVYPNLYLRVV